LVCLLVLVLRRDFRRERLSFLSNQSTCTAQ